MKALQVKRIIIAASAFSLIAGASIAFAESTSTIGGGATTSTAGEHRDWNARHRTSTQPVLNLSCVQMAVDKREAALGTAMTGYTAAVNAAFTTRATALHDAWSQTDKTVRKAAVRVAWKNFDAAIKKAKKDARMAKNIAWTQFRNDKKPCHAEGEQGEGPGDDMQI